MCLFVWFTVPPKSVDIINHNATITVGERDAVELECVVKEARPAASIIWYRNENVFRTGKYLVS